MTRGWWGRRGWMWPGERGNGHDSAEQAPERVRVPLRPPQGRETWICAFPSGGKTAHNSEAEARGRALGTAGAIWYPAIVEEDE